MQCLLALPQIRDECAGVHNFVIGVRSDPGGLQPSVHLCVLLDCRSLRPPLPVSGGAKAAHSMMEHVGVAVYRSLSGRNWHQAGPIAWAGVHH